MRHLTTLGMAAICGAATCTPAAADSAEALALVREIRRDFDAGRMAAIAEKVWADRSGSPRDDVDARAIGAMADRIYSLRGRAWEYGADEGASGSAERAIPVRVESKVVNFHLQAQGDRWLLRRIADAPASGFVARTPPLVDAAAEVVGDPSGPAAALLVLATSARSPAHASAGSVLWSRWGEWEPGRRHMPWELIGDLDGLLRAAGETQENPIASTVELHGDEPQCMAACHVDLGANSWRVLLVEDGGWKIVRATALPMGARAAQGVGVPPALAARATAVAKTLLDATAQDDWETRSFETVLRPLFEIRGGASPVAARIDDVREFVRAIRPGWRAPAYRLGAVEYDTSRQRVVVVPVLFGDGDYLVRLNFLEHPDGQLSVRGVRRGWPGDFVPPPK